MKTLNDVKVGNTVSVVRLHGEGAVKKRLMDMELTKGTSIAVRKLAPLGDPIEVTVRNYELSIGKLMHRWLKSSNWRTKPACKLSKTETPQFPIFFVE